MPGMPVQTVGAPASSPPDADLRRTYVLVIVVEVLTIAALYWLGRVFS